jgi:hypothetical protein
LRHPMRRPGYTAATNKRPLGFGMVAHGNLSFVDWRDRWNPPET